MVGVLERPDGPLRRRRLPARLEAVDGRGSNRFFFFLSLSLLSFLLLLLSDGSDMEPGIPCPMVEKMDFCFCFQKIIIQTTKKRLVDTE